MLTTLAEVAPSNRLDVGTRANGVRDRLNKEKTVLGLMLASEVIGGVK